MTRRHPRSLFLALAATALVAAPGAAFAVPPPSDPPPSNVPADAASGPQRASAVQPAEDGNGDLVLILAAGGILAAGTGAGAVVYGRRRSHPLHRI